MPLKLPLILSIVAAVFKNRADLVAENIALRHQLACFIRRGPRPRLRPVDRVFWVLFARFWIRWRKSPAMVAGHCFGLASQGLQALLAMEEPKTESRRTSNFGRSSQADRLRDYSE